MNEQSNQSRPAITVDALVTEFQELPALKRHTYFYIFLILLAVLGDTIKRSASTHQPDPGPSINEIQAP